MNGHHADPTPNTDPRAWGAIIAGCVTPIICVLVVGLVCCVLPAATIAKHL